MKAFNTGKFAEKVVALSEYDGTILTSLYQNPVNKQKIDRGAAFIIKNYFEEYLDAKAKQMPSSYHHIYEFDNVGQKNARLFKANVTSTAEGVVINYSFTPAKQPNREGYLFANKATVMEEGETLTITPNKSEYLQYTLADGRFVKSKKSVVPHPGGPDVKNSFESTFENFMKSQATMVLTKFRYFERIEEAVVAKRKIMIPRINSGMTKSAIAAAKTDADQIAGMVGNLYE